MRSDIARACRPRASGRHALAVLMAMCVPAPTTLSPGFTGYSQKVGAPSGP